MNVSNNMHGISYCGTAVLRRKDNYGKPECIVKKADDAEMQAIKEKNNISDSVFLAVKHAVYPASCIEEIDKKHIAYVNDAFKALALNPSDIGNVKSISFDKDYIQFEGEKGLLVVTKDTYSGDIGKIVVDRFI